MKSRKPQIYGFMAWNKGNGLALMLNLIDSIIILMFI
ncbi:MAG: hypothetical protein OJF51_003749 [Nitrospira sp.]|jgi:hypothetical protein|nr:MAG: hypothetical protein OJF51_003749 [Nitrospira sp.]